GQNDAPARRRARDPRRRRARVRPVLPEHDALRPREHRGQKLRDLDLVAMEQLGHDRGPRVLPERLADGGMVVAEQRRAEAELQVDELAPVVVPDPRAFAAREVPRHDVPERLVVPQALRPRLGEHGLGAPAPRLIAILAREPATERRAEHGYTAKRKWTMSRRAS